MSDESGKRWSELKTCLLDDFWQVDTSDLMHARADAWAAYIERQESDVAALRLRCEKAEAENVKLRELLQAVVDAHSDQDDGDGNVPMWAEADEPCIAYEVPDDYARDLAVDHARAALERE